MKLYGLEEKQAIVKGVACNLRATWTLSMDVYEGCGMARLLLTRGPTKHALLP
jgi:hypothetical protein